MPRTKYTQPMNIGALKLLNDRGDLVIPEVQRDLVWTKSQNQLLIDSLFKDFDIPKIYFRDVNNLGAMNYAQKFAEAYLKFSDERILNAEKPEDEQDQRMIRYSNATRGDSLEYLEYRQKVLREYILEEMDFLELKDQNRIFTPDQRAVIYRRGNGVCAECGISVSEDNFEADHVKPWSKGGRTIIANGQILCSHCNHTKSNHYKE